MPCEKSHSRDDNTWRLYYFAGVDLTKYHKLRSLNNKTLLSQFCSLEVQDPNIGRVFPSWRLRGRVGVVLCFFSWFTGNLCFPGLGLYHSNFWHLPHLAILPSAWVTWNVLFLSGHQSYWIKDPLCFSMASDNCIATTWFPNKVALGSAGG